jgi:hypothetical protein
VIAWLAKSALMQSPIGDFLKLIPKQVWIALLIVAAVVAAYLWHRHVVGNAIAAAEKRGSNAAYASVAEQAAMLKNKADTLARTAAGIAKEKNDEVHGRIDADAGALLVRDAGRATCTGVAGSAAGTNQRPVGNDEADASVDRLPDDVGTALIALPFPGTVAFARQNDRCIADLRAYEQRDQLIAAGQNKLAEGKRP